MSNTGDKQLRTWPSCTVHLGHHPTKCTLCQARGSGPVAKAQKVSAKLAFQARTGTFEAVTKDRKLRGKI